MAATRDYAVGRLMVLQTVFLRSTRNVSHKFKALFTTGGNAELVRVAKFVQIITIHDTALCTYPQLMWFRTIVNACVSHTPVGVDIWEQIYKSSTC